MRADFKQESFAEGCFNKIFQGVSFKGIGLELSRVKGIRIKEIVEVERIENYKLPLLMFLLEDDSLLHVKIINDEIKPDLQSMLTYDISIVLRYRMQVKTFILNFGSAQNGERGKCFGSLCYEAQIVDLSGIDAGKVYEELSQKIGSGCLLDGRDKLKLVFLPFMKNSLSFNEVLPKVMSLIEKMKDEEERMAYLTIILEIVSRLIGKQGVEVLKEYLMDTEVGVRIKDEGKKEGMRESIMVILLGKFNALPDDVYHAIAEQNNENILMKWLQNVTSICSVDELKEMVLT